MPSFGFPVHRTLAVVALAASTLFVPPALSTQSAARANTVFVLAQAPAPIPADRADDGRRPSANPANGVADARKEPANPIPRGTPTTSDAAETRTGPAAPRSESGRNAPKIRVAIVLPLESPSFQRAAEAVRGGFLAAAAAAAAEDIVAVIPYGDGGFEGALIAARFADPEWIVGPLTRDDVTALAAVTDPLPPVLALNQPADSTSLPPGVYTFSLAVEHEARQVARRLRADGRQKAYVITGSTALDRRFAQGFAAEWERAGGEIVGRASAAASSSLGRRLRQELARVSADVTFLAVESTAAQAIRSSLGNTLVFSGSSIYEGQDAANIRDLEGIRFFAMPWLVAPDHRAVMAYSRPNLGSVALERLYAFGIDAWRLVAQLRQGDNPAAIRLDGVIGRISADGDRNFAAEGVLTVIRNGQIVPLEEQ